MDVDLDRRQSLLSCLSLSLSLLSLLRALQTFEATVGAGLLLLSVSARRLTV